MANGHVQVQCGDPGRTQVKDQDSCAITISTVVEIMVDGIR